MSALIEVDGLRRDFGGRPAVAGITFAVNRGEVLGFLGPNGAGKSTTMRMIAGYLAPTAGTARVAGFDVHREPVRCKERLGYLPEGAPLYPEMTPAAFLSFIADIRGLKGRSKAERLEEVAERVGLREVWGQTIETLSKGYRRRLALAQAMIHDPEVLILDEPTDGLDPNQKHEVRRQVKAMAANKAIVISTHILEEVEAVCTRAIVISRGRIVADGTPDQLKGMHPSGRMDEVFRALTLGAELPGAAA